MKKILLILLLLDSAGSYAQDLTGTWVGIHTSNTSRGRKLIFYERFYLKQLGSFVWGVGQELNEITSDYKFEIDKAVVLCEFPITGEIPYIMDSAKLIPLYRGNITEAEIPMIYCEFPFYFDVVYKRINNAEYLTGKWYSIYGSTVRDNGSKGAIALRKISSASPDFVDEHIPKLEKLLQKSLRKDSSYLVKLGVYDKIFSPVNETKYLIDSLISPIAIADKTEDIRENIVQRIIDIDTAFIKIDLYDNGIVDDDTVSVFLNGGKIVNSRRLTANPLHMELELDDKEDNELKLFADNLGEIPPNTALMIVTCGDKKIEVNLSASLGNNAVVIFRKMKKAP